MKKSFIALAVLGSFAGVAAAQSSVTLFGIMDAAARSTKNGSAGTVQSLASDGYGASQWGIRGTEDLGGGTSAQFWLESQIAADTGAGGSNSLSGQFFNRRATVALANTAAGEVRLGRDYTPTHTLQCSFDPFGCNGVGQSSNFRSSTATAINQGFGSTAGSLTGNQNTLVRANNSVQYILPSNLGGVNGAVMVTAGEGAATSATGSSKAMGARLGYAAGPVSVAAAFMNTKNTLVANETFKDMDFAASYDFGVVKAGLLHRIYKFQNAKLATTSVALAAPVGAAGTVKAQIVRANQSGTSSANANIDGNDATQLSLGYQHDLSKRTALYGTLSQIKNKGNATFTVPGGPSGIKAGEKSTGYEVGVRHMF